MRCWYTWLISQDLWIKGACVAQEGLRHSDSEEKTKVLNPLKSKDTRYSFSTDGTKERIKVVDSIISKCMAL